MKRINLRLLEVFRAVFDAKSVTEAAVALNVSQPAVSKSIVQLEQELGVKLFDRVQGRLRPTAEGEWVYSEFCGLFAHVKAFEQSVRNLDCGRQKKITVAAVPTLAAPLVAQAAALFAARWRAVNVDVIIAQSDDVIRDTALHRVDFGLVHSNFRDRNICSEIIGETEIVAVLRKDHALAEMQVLAPESLADVPIIMFDSNAPPSHLVRESFEVAHARMNVVMRANSSAVAAAAACAGLGIALIDPWPMLNSPPSGVVLRRFSPRIPLRMAMISSIFRPPSDLAAEMFDAICTVLGDFAKFSDVVKTAKAIDVSSERP